MNRKRKAEEDVLEVAECCFGCYLKENCHRNFKPENTSFLNLPEQNLKWRAGLINETGSAISTICKYHTYKFGDGFKKQFTKCCNLFGNHVNKVKGGHLVTYEIAYQLKSKGVHVVPGWQLCRSCYEKVTKAEDNDSCGTECSDDNGMLQIETEVEKYAEKEQLNNSLVSLGISPLKTHSLPKSTRASAARTKLGHCFDRVKDMTASAYDISKSDLSDSESEIESSVLQKARDMDRLLYHMKEKLSDSTLKMSRKIQILTIALESWSRTEVASFFNVSEYMVREARKVAKSKGIFESPDPKKGWTLSDDVIKDVLMFFEDDEYSRLMPGTKDYVSVGKRVHKQKRLLLCNLKELYSAFKEKYPDSKIGFSKFCSLRPKWCVTVSSSGTHSVCVCTIHQNTKLHVDSLSSTINRCIKQINENENLEEDNQGLQKFNIDYKTLMQMIVCDIECLECMVHRCEKCPGYNNLESFITGKFAEFEIDDDITYIQWDSTDRTALRNYTSSTDEFIELLVYNLDKLTAHFSLQKVRPDI